ncbi:MAG: hypothetical protein E7618_03070 [Ruminococcaceae bacterium]|nr:hypothetical protein [Oscillospiraceae bacterium]
MNNEPEIKQDEVLAPEGDNEGNIAVKRNKIADFVAKIGCLLIAFILWYYAAGSDTSVYEQTFSSIPIEIVNESGFSVLSGDDVTVDLTLSGKRNLLKRLTAEDIRAYIDMSTITAAGPYTFEVRYDLPNGVTLEKTTSSKIQIYADNTASVSVPVRVSVIGYRLEDGYELGLSSVTTGVRHVIVTGPEAVVNEIEYAKLTADLGSANITRTVTYSDTIVLIDKDGKEVRNSYVTMNVSTVTATIPVYKYRDVPIEITYRYGLFHNNNCEVKAEPAFVKIRGEADEVDAVRLRYEINEKEISSHVTYTVNVSLPSTVVNLNGVETAVLSVTLKNMMVKTFSLYDIRVTNNPNGLLYDPIFGSLKVTVCGDSSLVGQLTVGDIWADVDLGNLQSGFEGTVELPVTIGFAGEYAGKLYEVEGDEPYTVSLQIRSSVEGEL